MMQLHHFLQILPRSNVYKQKLSSLLRCVLIALMLLANIANVSAKEQAPLELVMVTSDHCPFCKAWERDVGFIYSNTPYAQKARLRRVDIADVASTLPELPTIVFGTPTFLILENNMEVGRIEGYQSSDLFFWALSEYVNP